MAISVGLQIDAHALKAVVLNGSETSARIVDVIVEKLDGSQETDIVSLVEGVFSKHKLPRGNVVASIRALDCVMRDCVVPFKTEQQINSTIKYQAESYFHGVAVDELIVQYSKYGENEAGSRLLVTGVKKAVVERRLGLLGEVGVDPVSVDLDLAALANAYIAAGVCREHKLVVLVDIEANNLRIAVLENGQLRTARSIRKRFGERKSDKAKDGSERLPVVILDDGNDEDSFTLEDSGITSMERDSYLSGVFREIDKTVALCNSDESVDFMCLTGSACALPGIEDMFEDYFEVEVRKIDFGKPYGGLPSGVPDISAKAVVPLGLALKGLGVDAIGMDFRQEEFVFQGRFEKVKRGLACTLCLTFVLSFLYAFHLKQELRVKRTRLQSVKLVQQHLYTVLFPLFNDPLKEKVHKDPLVPFNPTKPHATDWPKALSLEYDRLATLFGNQLTKKSVKQSAIDILREFAFYKAKVKLPIEVTRARISQDATRIHCVSPQQSAAVAITRELQESKLFKSTHERIARKDDLWEFDVVLELYSEEEMEALAEKAKESSGE